MALKFVFTIIHLVMPKLLSTHKLKFLACLEPPKTFSVVVGEKRRTEEKSEQENIDPKCLLLFPN